MNCKYHPNQEAQSICVKCKNPICPECTIKVDDKTACRQCLEQNLSFTPAPALPINSTSKTFLGKFLFLCYSLVPGAAHMHLGLFRRGIELMIIAFGGFTLINFIGLDFLIPFVVIPVWFFSFFESHHLRKQVEKGQTISDQELFDRKLLDYTPLLKNRRLIGSCVIVVGILSLLRELDHSRVLDRLFGDYFYLIRGSFIPICLILGGIYLIIQAARSRPAKELPENQELSEKHNLQ